ncbi:hypothetical protein ASE74_02315 [Pedobacter sp. Leaf216]|nr:hypothetical protein ASE74_02315 [Pedobacter sp. Leaf216]
MKTILSAAKIRFKYIVLAVDKKTSAAKTCLKFIILAADNELYLNPAFFDIIGTNYLLNP